MTLDQGIFVIVVAFFILTVLLAAKYGDRDK